MTIHANITAHKGWLAIELLATKSIENEVSTSLDNPGNFGQVIMQTEKHLGVSPQALALMKTLRRGRGSLGQIDWFVTNQPGQPVGFAFGWIGGPQALVKIADCETTRDWLVGKYVEISNDLLPAEAKAAIEAAEK